MRYIEIMDATTTRCYRTPIDRERAIAQLCNHGFNEFVCRQTDEGYTLRYRTASWLAPNHTAINR